MTELELEPHRHPEAKIESLREKVQRTRERMIELAERDAADRIADAVSVQIVTVEEALDLLSAGDDVARKIG